ncbi:MAG: phenylalanine--tRNA ligase subunit beta [Rhodospirillales bacterium]|nr:phenylalanine--tRNA ligase subunit beta [Rhodospirillales bacterium]
MKFTLSWLKDHLETAASLDEITARLPMIGLEVESVVDRAAPLRDFVVAEVISAAPHPNADKLQVLSVDTGCERLQVVCGAPNARAGLKGVFAKVGSVIPDGGVTLKPAKIRGVDSSGMMLSEREMQLSDAHTGIVELPADAVVGSAAAEAMGLADPLIDVAITPNRGDCLGVRGIARDLAAAGLGRLKPLDVAPVKGEGACPIGVRLAFAEGTGDACSYFAGRLIRGVVNRPSPKWLQDRLTAVGLRPISALVDITNYVTADLCRPLHVFDADRLTTHTTGGLTVRLAGEGETLAALNDKTYALTPEMTVVADDAGAQALGGVIGGEPTACSEATVNVFVESALFDPVRTAMTGRALSIASDARYRFERGIDAAFVEPGLEVATRLILELCGGEASEVVVAGAAPSAPAPIAFRPRRVETLAGVSATDAECAAILAALGFAGPFSGETWSVGVPSWRNDIAGEACLVEEVVRLMGFARIPALDLPRLASLPAPALTPAQRRRARVRRTLAARGLIEAVTYSFLASRAATLFGGGDDTGGGGLRLVNAISADLDTMRPSLLPNLIEAAGRNAARGQKDAALFEVGPQYAGSAPEQQAIVAASVRAGRSGERHWAVAVRPVDAFDAKADALAALDAAGARTDKLTVEPLAPAWYHPGRSGALKLGPKQVLAWFGEVHPRVLQQLGVAGPIVASEVFLDAVAPKAPSTAARPALTLSALQPLERDFAFVVDAGVSADAVVRAARAADKALIADVRVFDVYEGGSLGEGRKSLAITAVLAPAERTLTDAEIDALGARLIAAVSKATGATLRS